MTGRPSVSRISAKIGSAASSPTPRAAEPEVRLALSNDDLEDEADGAPRGDLLQRLSHLERVGPAFELAGPAISASGSAEPKRAASGPRPT